MASSLRAGSAAATITPPLGTPMAGYLTERWAEGVLDDVTAQAVAMESDQGASVIIGCDLIGIPNEMADWVREDVSSQTGVPRDSIIVAATHTHTGPSVPRDLAESRHEKYLDLLPEMISSAGIMAHRRLQPAQVRRAVGQAPGLAFNRRYLMSDGTVRTNPGSLNPDVVEPVGPVDERVRVLRLDDEQGEFFALIVNFGLHLDTHSGSLISADYPHFLRQTLASAMGGSVRTVFLNGPCGDINHVDVSKPWEQGRAMTRRIGMSLAGAVLRALPLAEAVEGPEVIRGLSRRLSFATRFPTAEELTEAQTVLGDNWRDLESCYRPATAEEVAALSESWQHDGQRVFDVHRHALREKLLLAEMDKRSLEVELTAVRVGNVAITTNPGEVFCQLGLDIRAQSPFAETFLVELANGFVGYIPTRDAVTEGGYETTVRRWACIEAGAGEEIVAATAEMLGQLA